MSNETENPSDTTPPSTNYSIDDVDVAIGTVSPVPPEEIFGIKAASQLSGNDNDEAEEEEVDQMLIDELTMKLEDIGGPNKEEKKDDVDVEDVAIHDQLPDVEEYKASLAANASSSKSGSNNPVIDIYRRSAFTPLFRRRVMYIVGAAAVLFAIVFVAKHLAGRKDDTFQAPPSRVNEVIEFLFEYGVSDLPILTEKHTPQHKAVQFMAAGDIYHEVLQTETPDMFIERYVLALIYYHFNGRKWNYKLNFLSGQDHCLWHQDFESSNGKQIREGVVCDENGRVVALNLCKFLSSFSCLILFCRDNCF